MARNANRRNVQIEALGEAITQDLAFYSNNVHRAVQAAGEKAVKDLVKKTKATAPIGHRKKFRRSITHSVKNKNQRNTTYVWHVKAPDYRLTHLLVHGHATKEGGRTRPDPFLKNALAEVLPQFEKDVEEAIKNG